jgi:surface protein
VANACGNIYSSFQLTLLSFHHTQDTFNQPLHWNTTSATDMTSMFQYAHSFNQDIASWDTRNVASFYLMFAFAFAFDQDISRWSVAASCYFDYALYYATSFNQNMNPWEQQCFGNGASPTVYLMFYGSTCPVQIASIPGDFCQLAPSAMPSVSFLPSMAPSLSSLPSTSPSRYPTRIPTRRQTKKLTKPPARASKGAFNVRVCLADAVKHCSCKKRIKTNQCLNALTTACKAKFVAAGGAVNKFITLAKAAARHRKCDTDEKSG